MPAPLALVALACAAPCLPQYFPADIPLQPTEYASPSGAWSIEIDPSERYGGGPGDYRVLRAGQPIWTKRLPFTLREALVDDEGYLAGYGYSEGWNALSAEGELFVALVSPTGEVVARHATSMQHSLELHSPPDPQVTDLILDAEHRRFVVRVDDSHFEHDTEQWQVYDLRTGELLDAFQPAVRAGDFGELNARVWAAQPMPGRALYALYWWIPHWDADTDKHAVRLSAIDLGGDPVWSLDLPGELDVEDEDGDLTVWSHERGTGPLLAVEPEGRFSAWLPRSGVRAKFQVWRDLGEATWRGEELEREPFTPAPVEISPDPPVQAVELALLGEAELRAGSAGDLGPIHDIAAFGFDELGRILLARMDDRLARMDDREAKRFTCLLLDESGEVLLERGFGPLELAVDGAVEWWPFESGRWLVTCSPWGTEARSQAWWADPATGSLEQLPNWDFPTVDAVASTRDGGFAVLGTYHFEYTVSEVLARCDATGRTSWRIVQGGYGDEASELLSPNDLAVTSEGLLVLVDPIRDALMVFDPGGTWRENVDLAEAWGEDPQYPSCVRAGAGGDLVVIASASELPVRVVEPDGRLRKSLLPRLEDGSRESVLPYEVRIAPDGRLWTTDRRVLLRLGQDGVADRTLGPRADAQALSEPVNLLIDPLGRVVIQDQRTHALHAFDQTGERLFVAVLEPTDFGGRVSILDRLACGGDGSLYARMSALEGGWMRFGPHGERIGPVDLGARGVVFQPHSELRWAKDLDGKGQVAQLDAAGSVRLRLARRQDRRWFESVATPGVTASGEVAVVETLHVEGRGATLSLFAPDGKPRALWQLPADSPAWDVVHTGRWVIVAGLQGPVLLVSTEDGHLKRFLPPRGAGSEKTRRTVGASPDGRELWIVETEPLRLVRYALP